MNLYQLSDKERQELKDVLLEIYRDIAAVCEKHRLAVVLGGGTCLGAVRHQGFIPWDDDIDLNLSRKDYNTFIEKFDAELGDRYVLVEPGATGTGQRLFAKVVKKGTTFVQAGTSDRFVADSGIYVDIFPIESLPDNGLARVAFLALAHLFTRVTKIISEYQYRRPLVTRTHHLLIGRLTSFLPYHRWHALYTLFIGSSSGTRYCTIPSGRRGVYGEMQPFSTFFPGRDGVFEGLQVKLPRDYDRYLSSLYGDYMQLPPEDQRHTLHQLIAFSTTRALVESTGNSF